MVDEAECKILYNGMNNTRSRTLHAGKLIETARYVD